MVGTTLDIKSIIQPDSMAKMIGNTYQSYNSFRLGWVADKTELRNFIFATSTKTTTNNKLPWKNSTTIPKLCQIRDNLHANYMAALFPQSEWFKWEGGEDEAEFADTRKVIQAYIQNKVDQSGFKQTISQLIYDYIDYGNVFATTTWINESSKDENGKTVVGYIGPKIVRISPLDVIFNPTANDFPSSPKIVKAIKSLGEVVKEVDNYPSADAKALASYALDRARDVRRAFAGVSPADLAKFEAFMIDGFGDIKQYFGSGLVEVLTFYGDLYDVEAGVLYQDHIITVIDRSFVLSKTPNPYWRQNGVIKHAGWRLRPDNLYAQGPLDNLVGMQYRIDHLENLKADAFDLFAFPVIKVKGYVEDFEYAPNERIYVGDDGDVEFMRPDASALSADTMIEKLEMKMEEMAGAPREAMGIRTPGEKTAYEVQNLQNAASRLFQNKIDYFEEMVVDPLLNDMLELARRNLPISDLVRYFDDKTQVVEFIKVTQDDLSVSGKIRPMGATHFAQRNMMIQNWTNFSNSAIGQDPAVNVHMSGKRLAHVFEELFDSEQYGIVSDNIRVIEQAETQQLAQAASENLQQQNATPGPGEAPLAGGAPPETTRNGVTGEAPAGNPSTPAPNQRQRPVQTLPGR